MSAVMKRMLVGILLASVVALLLVPSIRDQAQTAGFFAVLFVVLGGLPFLLGVVAQLVMRDHELRDGVLLVCAVILMLPWWFWGQGFSVTVPGPRILSFGVSVVFLTWFTGLGAASVRAIGRRRDARTSSPTPEA